MKKVPLAPDVDPRVIARGTPGFSGADLANLVNEAALLAARKGKRLVAMSEFEEAKDKVMMGTERRSMVMTEDEKKMTAYHEAGHAIVAIHEPASDPIHKATIIPRGRALGMVMRLPERDNYSYHRDKMYANLAVGDGRPRRRGSDLRLRQGQLGRVVATSAMRPASPATWSPAGACRTSSGPLQYAEADEEVFLGYSVNRQKNMSNETAQAIDKEIRRIVEQGYDRAKTVARRSIATSSRRWPRRCSNMRRCRATRSRRCSTAARSTAAARAEPALPTAGSSIPKAEAAQVRHRRRRARGRLSRRSNVVHRPSLAADRAGRVFHAVVRLLRG